MEIEIFYKKNRFVISRVGGCKNDGPLDSIVKLFEFVVVDVTHFLFVTWKLQRACSIELLISYANKNVYFFGSFYSLSLSPIKASTILNVHAATQLCLIK